MASFHFELVAPDKLLFNGEAEEVLVPGSEGDFVVLRDHAAVMTSLRPGIVDIGEGAGKHTRLFVRGGFADVNAAGLILLAETAILVMGEFGRTPKIADVFGGGRDHWPHAYSVIWAGGGIQGGQVIGASDAHAAYVKDRPLKPDDLSATLYEALGIPFETMLHDIGDRPRRISEGTPIHELLG